jgi:hypothetical protein
VQSVRFGRSLFVSVGHADERNGEKSRTSVPQRTAHGEYGPKCRTFIWAVSLKMSLADCVQASDVDNYDSNWVQIAQSQQWPKQSGFDYRHGGKATEAYSYTSSTHKFPCCTAVTSSFSLHIVFIFSPNCIYQKEERARSKFFSAKKFLSSAVININQVPFRNSQLLVSKVFFLFLFFFILLLLLLLPLLSLSGSLRIHRTLHWIDWCPKTLPRAIQQIFMKSLYPDGLSISRSRKVIHGISNLQESLIFYMQVYDKGKPRSKLV